MNDFSNLTEIHVNEATNNAVPNDVFKFKRYMAGSSRHRTAKVRGQRSKSRPKHQTIKTSDHIQIEGQNQTMSMGQLHGF